MASSVSEPAPDAVPATLQRAAQSYQPPTVNPYTGPNTADAVTLPTTFTAVCVPSSFPANYQLVPATATGTFTAGSSCANPSTGTTTTYSWTTGQQYYAYTSNLVIPTSTTLTLVPGTYFFVNASLTLNGPIQCKVSTASGAAACSQAQQQGVTIIMTGNPGSVGNLTINSSATGTLNALGTQTGSYSNSKGMGSTYSALNGMLFYRRGYGSDTSTAPGVNISGNASSLILNGVMYFPNSYVSYGANGNTGNSMICSILVGGYLTLTNAASRFTTASCEDFGFTRTTMPQVQAVRVVE